MDLGGQLRVDWNCSSKVVQQSERAEVEIQDGPSKVYTILSPEQLKGGSITYMRTTGNVLVRLAVQGANQPPVTETTRFLGSPVAAPAAPSVAADGPPPRPEAVQPASLTQASREVEHAASPDPPRQPPRAEKPLKAETTPQRIVFRPPPRRLALPPAAPARAHEGLSEPPPTAPAIAVNNAPQLPPLIPRLPAAIAPANPTPAAPSMVPAPAAPTPKRGETNPISIRPAAGKMIWTGKVLRRGTIEIVGDHASPGHIVGGLPGSPVRVQVFPAELGPQGLRIYTADPALLGAPEAPGAQNGWNQTVYVLNPRRATEISVQEAPAERNGWKRLILRAERGDYSILVLRWQTIPPESLRSQQDR